MTSRKDDVATAIRSCLLTSKNGISLANLNGEYKSLEGKNIPYQEFGFRSLESFVRCVPGIRTIERGSDIWVQTVPTKETAHISKLVSEQKAPKTRRRRSHLRPFPKNNQQTSRRNLRPISSSQKTPNRPFDTRTNYPSQLQIRDSAPKPLMEMQIQLPPSLTGSHRYMGTAGGVQSSPSQRLIERRTQLNQELDNAIKPNKNLPKSINSRQASKILEIDSSGIPDNPGIAGLAVSDKRSEVEAPIQPRKLSPVRFPWQPPPPSKRMISDRLTVQQHPNPSLINNSNIRITFSNDRALKDVAVQKTISSFQDSKEKELEKIARDLGRGDPVYKVYTDQGKEGTTFYAQVVVGSVKFISYPNEAKTREEAMDFAADRALVELRKEHMATKKLVCTTDVNVMKKRLLEIVEKNGVFTHKIPEIYRQKFNENLVDNWIDKITNWKDVTLETGVNGLMIISRTDTLEHNNALKASPPVTGKSLLKSVNHLEPGNVELPDEECWPAEVTHVISTVEIWIRLIGENYNEKLESMTIEMTDYYSTMTTSAEIIERGDYYAIMDNETWYRVRVIDYDEKTNEVDIFFIDIGDEDNVNSSLLYPLERKFRHLSAQAMRISLDGLDSFAHCESVLPLIEKTICGGVFYMREVNRQIDDNGPSANVVIYDTTGTDDVDLNYMMKKMILHSFEPKLDTIDDLVDVYVSHVEPNGDIFVQLNNDGLKVLVKMIKDLTETGLSAEELQRCALNSVDMKNVYFVRCIETGNWLRGKFIDVAPDSLDGTFRLIMYLLDFGRTIVVEPRNVIELEKLSDTLANYPAQATKVTLDKVDTIVSGFADRFVKRMKELAPSNELLLLKIVQPQIENSPPSVELYKTMSDNVVGSINLTLEREFKCLKCVNGDGNNNVKLSRQRIGKSNPRTTPEIEESARVLDAPKISEIGEYFDVHVTMAANPSNFTVQPFKSLEELRIMMKNLQEACANLNTHPTLQSVKEGQLYAVRHNDGDWYRGCVMNVIVQEGILTIYFVDYGDIDFVELNNLLPLSKEFFDLPYQAIKARLSGIKPRKNDWTPEDCVRFQQLTVDRNLVSVVDKIDPDRCLPRETVLSLNLIDVSTNDDIYIREVLVNEERAIFCDD